MPFLLWNENMKSNFDRFILRKINHDTRNLMKTENKNEEEIVV